MRDFERHKKIIGEKFNKLTVVELVKIEERKDRKNAYNYFYKCICDCGNETIILKENLGKTLSCGCAKKNPPIITKHGYSRHDGTKEKLYCVWSAIKDRCLNSKNKFYYRYGGRGITICKEWENDYPAFRKFCLNNGYKEGVEIDRINNDGNYEPSNCRFVTHRENLLNTHRSKKYKKEVI